MNKSVLITGSSKGIGKAIAIEFAKNGYNVGINYNCSRDAADDVKREILSLGVDAELFKCDVSSAEECKKLSQEFISRFGKIDVLINNAGVSKVSPVNDMSFTEWEKIINTNLSSAFYLSRSLLPFFLDSKSGCIINISSVWGVSGASCEVAYSTSKAGLIGFTKALAKELGPSGIRVNCISPGIINTDMNNSVDNKILSELADASALGRIGNPSEIAKIALFLASDNASYITAQNIIADGGFL